MAVVVNVGVDSGMGKIRGVGMKGIGRNREEEG